MAAVQPKHQVIDNFLQQPQQQVAKWKNSPAREQLRADVISGKVNDSMDPSDVHASRLEYQQYALSNFTGYLETMIKSILADFERMAVDCEAYGHDIAIIHQRWEDNAPTTQRPWHRTICPKKLKEDVDTGKHLVIDRDTGKKISAKKLRQSRHCYKEFDLKVFRKHLYQEIDKRGKVDVRMSKKRFRIKPPPDVQFDVVGNEPKRTKTTAVV
ncbi:hypothetical protein SEMRO_116_G057070.1 [Seminavis robusta]|uniref:Uncharacterized protein n=1 Tax=Seminavis robusta TaxID=568900 RepID=A0A9N8DFH5_9STRA|nr:hypothetical protein SEMRO_116_G057070.1 [Seminavis robusta]|eukprot:Sro116_g057070.1 n/a (213) ;mRNA; f:58033-58671